MLSPQFQGGLAYTLKMMPGKVGAPVEVYGEGAALRSNRLLTYQTLPARHGTEGNEMRDSQAAFVGQPASLNSGGPAAVVSAGTSEGLKGEPAYFNHPLTTEPYPSRLPDQGVETVAAPIEDPFEQQLQAFAASVTTGDSTRLAGLFVPDQVAFPIVQQPSRSPAFVSSEPQIVTQFSLASQYGSIGLLAHNSFAGSAFHNFHEGQGLHLVYGDGKTALYRIETIRHLQALSPNSLQSDFLDLDNGNQRLTALELFNQVYAQPDRLVLQTCIASDGIGAWGRLFVIATPEQGQEGQLVRSP